MKKRFLLLLATAILSTGSMIAQPSDESGKYSFNYTKIVPGMPENASFGAYGNMSMNTSKGLPNINFDLYTLSKGGVSVPISISYDASGVKHNDIPSCVGMKWSLNAGGSINRSVNGIVDEDFLLDNLFVIDSARVANQNAHITRYNMQDSCHHVADNTYDFSLDYYFYSFPGQTGSMYLGKNKIFRADKEYSKIKIDAANHLDSFTVKDGAGNTYIFGTYTDNSTVYNTGKYNKQSKTSFSARVAWKLKKIVTATKQEIHFQYTPYNYEYITLDSERYTVYEHGGGGMTAPGCSYTMPFNGSEFQSTRYVNTASILTKIYTDDQEVLFNYFTDDSLTVFRQRLASIKVYSKISADTIKRIFLNNAGGYLTSFTEKDKSNAAINKTYSFNYNGGPLPEFYTKARDIFGYFNNATANNSLIDNPAMFTMYYPMGVGNRSVNENAAKAGILEGITYPTGGKTSFTYEYNKEGSGVNTYYSPGFRIRSIWDADANNKVYNKKNFYYKGLAGGIRHGDMTIVNENSVYLDPAIYQVYHSQPPDIYGLEKYYYENVTIENIGNDTSSKRFFEKDYYSYQLGIYGSEPYLTKKEIFDTDTFHIQKRTTYDYDVVTVDSLTTRIYTLGKPYAIMGSFTFEGQPTPTTFCPAFGIYQPFETKHIIKPTLYNLKTVTEKEYSSVGDSVVNVINHFYNPHSAFLQRSESTGSDNVTSVVKYYYPSDFPGNSTLTAMKNEFINPVVKEQYLFNSVLTKEKESSYGLHPSGFYVVTNQVVKDVPANKTQTLNFYGYNQKGMLLSRGLAKDIKTSYIWDYLNELPVAEVINADTASIAYTSFEADGKGRWSFSGAISNDVNAITGKKDYALSGGQITKAGLTAATSYFVTYWSKTTAITVTGTVATWPKQLASVMVGTQNWKLYEHKISGQTSINVSGSAIIDELRLYPEYAQMSTYAYLPLVGISSQSDIQGRTLYYQYDGMNRLALVKDENNNVVKRICYNYLGQPEDCPQTVYWNNAISATFTKNCGAGFIGSKHIYSVAAGTYSSPTSQAAADALAAANFTTNGQSYANTNGSCVPIYYNVVKSGTFTRNNCTPPQTGSTVTYTVAANTYNSLVSQAAADALAQADVNANGQNYANTTGTCALVCVPACTAVFRKCINGGCEIGIKVYTSQVYDSQTGYTCTYHWEWSDGSWSQDYTENSPLQPCWFN